MTQPQHPDPASVREAPLSEAPSDEDVEAFLAERMTPEGRVPMVRTIRDALVKWGNSPSQPEKPAVEDEREAFEAEWSDNGRWPKAIERDAHGDYKLMATQSAWGAWDRGWRAALSTAAVTAAEAPGWQLVPIEPTLAMLSAVDGEAEDKFIARGRAYSAWKSMIAAAPAQGKAVE